MDRDTVTDTAADDVIPLVAGVVIPGDRVVLNGASWLVVAGTTGERTRMLTLVRNTTTRRIRPRRSTPLDVVPRPRS